MKIKTSTRYHCPSCGAEVILGADTCDECEMDLQDVEWGKPASELLQTILHDRLSKLEPPHPVIASPDDPIRLVIEKMIERKHGAVVVVQDEKLVGIFTERDVILRVAGKPVDIETTPISEVMTNDPLSLRMDSTLALALNQMSVGGLRHLPILEGDKPVGITSVRGVLGYLATHAT